MLSEFFRSPFPLLRRGLAFLGKEALRTGAKIATDVADGQSFGDSTKKRVSERINEVVPGLLPQSGSGRRQRRTYAKRKKTPKRKNTPKRSRAKRRRLTGGGPLFD